VFIHGITSSGGVWREVLPELAENHSVLAPDLLGHRDSAQPRGASDRLYLSAEIPTLVVQHDRIIPVSHTHEAHEQMPGSRLDVFPNALEDRLRAPS